MPQTVIDLGRAMKAKHPGSYDDLSDEIVGRGLKAAHPGAYEDFSNSATADSDRQRALGSMQLDNPYSFSDTYGGGFLSSAWDAVKGLGHGVLSLPTPSPTFSSSDMQDLPVQPVQRTTDQLAAGNVPGALGTMTGTLAPLALTAAASHPAVRAMAGGAAKGAASTLADFHPHGPWGISLPAPFVGAGGGAWVGHELAPFLGHDAPVVGAVVGAGVPIVKGAIEGGRQGLADYRASVPPEPRSVPPIWHGIEPEPAPNFPTFTPLVSDLPSGRKVGGFGKVPADIPPIQATQVPSVETPPAPSTQTGPTLSPGQMPVPQHTALQGHALAIENKVSNITDYLAKNGITRPEVLDEMTPEQLKALANAAHTHGKTVGNPVPKSGYKGLEGDTLKMVQDRLRSLVPAQATIPPVQ